MTKQQFIAEINRAGAAMSARYSISRLIHGNISSGRDMVDRLRADVLALAKTVGNQSIVETALADYMDRGPLDLTYDLGVAGDLALSTAQREMEI